MVTFQNHVINLQFHSTSHIDYYVAEQESKYGKMYVIHADGPKIVAKYADHYGYIAARQSDRWAKKKMYLIIQGKTC